MELHDTLYTMEKVKQPGVTASVIKMEMREIHHDQYNARTTKVPISERSINLKNKLSAILTAVYYDFHQHLHVTAEVVPETVYENLLTIPLQVELQLTPKNKLTY